MTGSAVIVHEMALRKAWENAKEAYQDALDSKDGQRIRVTKIEVCEAYQKHMGVLGKGGRQWPSS